jgi:hypothetical protein
MHVGIRIYNTLDDLSFATDNYRDGLTYYLTNPHDVFNLNTNSR